MTIESEGCAPVCRSDGDTDDDGTIPADPGRRQEGDGPEPTVDRKIFLELSRERAERRYDVDECPHCSGTASTSGSGNGHYEALLVAAEDAPGEADD